MTSIIWIRIGLHWGWVAGAWMLCLLLNRLHVGAIERRTERFKKINEDLRKQREQAEKDTGKNKQQGR